MDFNLDYIRGWNVRQMVDHSIYFHNMKMNAIKESDLNRMSHYAGHAQIQSHYKTVGDQLFNQAGNIG